MLAKRTKLQTLHRRTDSFKKARKLKHKLFFDEKDLSVILLFTLVTFLIPLSFT